MDQAYGVERMPLANAANVAASFVALFRGPRVFYSNAEFANSADGLVATSTFGSVTTATFEAGVVGIDAERIGLFFVTDED